MVLLGDAASCVSLFGEGSSSASAGAATSARSLDEEAPQDVDRALLHYQASHEALTRRGQRGAAFAAHLLIPVTSAGITVRNRALRLTGHRAVPGSRPGGRKGSDAGGLEFPPVYSQTVAAALSESGTSRVPGDVHLMKSRRQPQTRRDSRRPDR